MMQNKLSLRLGRLKNVAARSFLWIKSFLKNFLTPPLLFQDRYTLSDASHVVRESSGEIGQYRQKVSLISTVKNEASLVEGWFDRILAQTRLPDEIVIVDGGSTDGTREKLQYFANTSQVPVRILSLPAGNIAQNRNLAVSEARFPIIAVTDFGCFPRHDWLEKITLPFEKNENVMVSAGIYEPIGLTGEGVYKQKELWAWHKVDRLDPQSYLPPGGSMAFRKEAWSAVGGYPEWLTLTGEDTYFDLELKHLGGEWALASNAVVEWVAPQGLFAYLKKLHNWAVGDGEAGLRGRDYWRYAQRLILVTILLMLTLAVPYILTGFLQVGEYFLPVYFLGALALGLAGAWAWAKKNRFPMRLLAYRILGEVSQLLGYIHGARQRPVVDSRRHAAVKGLVFLLSGVPIDDTGGGSRGAQFALEFLRRNYAVVYLSHFPKYESRDLGLRIAHPNLFAQTRAQFGFDAFARTHPALFQDKKITAMVEHPIADYLPVLERVRRLGGVTLYDLIDAWDAALGGQWYSPEIENKVIAQSQVLVATTPVLCARLEQVSGRKVHLVPNAVNAGLFNPRRRFPLPADMPPASRTCIYTGALWGDWFDWDLLQRLAVRVPETAFVIIGDYRGQCPQPAPNLHFLGLKKQSDLPAYLAHADVAIIPWKVNQVTQATSPLKVYEYLSMRLPVVAPRLDPLENIPGVYLSRGQEEFMELVGKLSRATLDEKEIEAFIRLNDWSARVDILLKSINAGSHT
jgi:hypothetical protein